MSTDLSIPMNPNTIIMLDTCSLMHTGCRPMLEALCPLLKRAHRQIVVPKKVIEELLRHSGCQDDARKAAQAREGLLLCRFLQQENCLTVRGDASENFADNVFYVHFSSLRLRHPLVLITQDRRLSQDILQLNHLQTQGGYPIQVYRITAGGMLTETKYD